MIALLPLSTPAPILTRENDRPQTPMSSSSPTQFSPARILWLFVPTIVFLLGVHAVLLYIVPRFEPIFSDFKIDHPAPTRQLNRRSRGDRQSDLWMWIGIGVLSGCVGALFRGGSQVP